LKLENTMTHENAATSGRYDDTLVDQIKAQIDLVQLIGEYTELKKAGSSHVGLCPLPSHTEKTGSFNVYDDGGYKCFGCGGHGDVFTFLQEVEGLDFPGAVKHAAEAAGITLTRDTELSNEQAVLWKVLQEVADWYAGSIKYFHDHAMGYIRSRNITEESVERHRLGYAAKKSGNLEPLVKKYGLAPFLELGLMKKPDVGEPYAFFRDRLVIPVLNRAGNVISFVGRAIDSDAKPKYLTLNTPFFERSKGVYGAHTVTELKGAIKMAEGPLDVIISAQVLGSQAVAPLGTDVTPDQLLQVLGWCTSLEVLADGDSAGLKAAVKIARLMPPMITRPTDVGFRIFPDGEDPGSWLPGRSNMDELKRSALDEVLICATRNRFDLSTWFGQSQAAAWITECLPPAPAGPAVEVLRSRIAIALGIPITALSTKEAVG